MSGRPAIWVLAAALPLAAQPEWHAARLSTDEQLARYSALAKAEPGNAAYSVQLAGAYLQKLRETADPAYLERAARLVEEALRADGGNYEALHLRAELALQGHRFASAAEQARELIRSRGEDVRNWAVLGDALLEQGRYDEAAEAYDRMAALRPGLASYNRVAQLRFVHGDAEGALAIMEMAVRAGSANAEHVAWCLAELGHMRFKTGRIGEAAEAYEAALRAFPRAHAALAGLGRVRAAEGRLSEAIASYRRAQELAPLPEYAAALAELYDLAGRAAEARRERDLLVVSDRLGKARGESANRALALALAERGGDAARALELARAELAVRQDVYSHDALAWVLYRNGRNAEAERHAAEALRLGTPEPLFYFHAGMIAAALGHGEEAARRLRRALELNPRFDPRRAREAETALARLSRAAGP